MTFELAKAQVSAAIGVPPPSNFGLAASFAVAALIREVGLTGALLVGGLGFPVIAAAGLRPLMRAEARTASAVDASETRVPVFTESMLATAASPVP
jgi:hypothetical protein